MNALVKGLFLTVLAASLFTAGSVVAEDLSLQAPAAQPQFKPGDVLAVADDNVSLMIGGQAVTAVPKGHRVLVVESRETWIGTSLTVNGEVKSGWIAAKNFIPSNCPPPAPVALVAQAITPGAYTAFRPVTPEQPAAAPPLAVAPPVRERPVFVERRDEYTIGYYERHETDPNMHVWEPWRR
jgi:hypothetical protein